MVAAVPSSALVSLDPVVGVPIGAKPRRRQQLVQHDRVGRRLIGDHLDGSDLGRARWPVQRTGGRPHVAPRETNTSMTWPNWSTARYA
jgi:hypothetical protein